MGWQQQANKMSMGQFVSVKQDMMVLVKFEGEPVMARGKNFKKEEVDELQFPVTFYDIRAVKDRYAEGEPLEIIRKGKGEAKIFPVQGGPKLRCIMEEDAIEPIVGKTIIMSHTGNAMNTVYKIREVMIPKQQRVQPLQDDQDEEMDEVEEPQPIQEAKKQNIEKEKKFSTPETVKRARKASIVVPPEDDESISPKFDENDKMIPEGEDKEKAKFKAEVAKRTAKRNKKVVKQDPPDEPIETDPREDQEDSE